MLFFSIFLAGFTVGVFAALKIFAPENHEDAWDPQHFPDTHQKHPSIVDSANWGAQLPFLLKELKRQRLQANSTSR